MATQTGDGKKVVLRSYHHPTETDQCFTIVEACLATSAAPFIFAPLQKGENGMAETFIDGGLGFNNPIYMVLNESHDIFPDQNINVLVSVGTGAKTPRRVGSNLASLAKKVAEMATDATREAEDFSFFVASRDPGLRDAYFRFDVNDGLSTIPLQEWRMLAIISQKTRTWLSKLSSKNKLEQCARLLTPVRIKDLNSGFMQRFSAKMKILKAYRKKPRCTDEFSRSTTFGALAGA